MAELLCFDETSFRRLDLLPKDGCLEAEVEARTVRVPLGHSRIVGSTVCYARQTPPARDLSFLMGQDELVFGRDMLEQPDPAVSARHFCLHQKGDSFELEDLDSMNGTYVNGRRVRRESLHFLDRVQCAGCSLLWMGSFFLCSFRQHGPSPPPVSVSPRPPGQAQAPPRPESRMLCVESWQLQQAPARQSLFLTCGSSLLMSAGTLLSAALLQTTGSGSPESVRTSLVMSLSMAASFLLYGLLARSVSGKQALRQIREQEAAYEAYLEDIDAAMKQVKTQIRQAEEVQARLWSRLDDSLWQSGLPVPAGWEEAALLTLEIPAFSWQHRRHPLYDRIRQLVSEAARPIRILSYPDLSGPVMACRTSLFAMIVWSQDPGRVKWAGPSGLEGYYPHQFYGGKPVTERCSGCKVAGLQVQPAPGLRCDTGRLREARFLPETADCEQQQPETGPCYRVRIGRDPAGQPVFLDLEKDGPHGLVAGTTGSGKSEAMCTLIASLMYRNSPDWFRFILLDFKGGAFARPFQDAPHCAGVITDLEDSAVRTLHLALQGEIERREQAMQAFLEEHPDATPDLESFNRLSGQPLPLLLVAADEFAQLKERFPQELAFLQSVARIGRSLGICLLLATQRPQGIVDAQIMANTGYVMCFKVRDRFESQEVLQDDRAAKLRGSGDGWLNDTRFQADYARRQTGGGRLQTPQGQVLLEAGSHTWLDGILQACRTRYEPCPPLVLAAPSAYEGPGLGLVTDVVGARQYPFDPAHGSCTCILAPENRLQVQEAIRNAWDDVVLVTDGNAWFARNHPEPLTLLLQDQDPAVFMAFDRRVMLVLTRPVQISVSCDDTIFLGSAAALSRFRPCRQDSLWPQARLQKEGLSLCFHTGTQPHDFCRLPDFGQPEDWQAVFEIPVLGYSPDGPVFWDGDPISICGLQAEQMAARLRQWRPDYPAPVTEKEDAPVCLYTDGWKQEAWKMGIPSGISGRWVLKQGGTWLGLEPLIHA